jgi:hypothetical protein
MPYSRRDLYDRKQQLRNAGLDVERGQVTLHNNQETSLHLTVKSLLGWWIRRSGRPFSTEVEYPSGDVADVIDWGPPDGRAVVFEVETEPDEHTEAVYRDKYCGPDVIRDVEIVDLRDSPADLDDLARWVRDHVVGTS